MVLSNHLVQRGDSPADLPRTRDAGPHLQPNPLPSRNLGHLGDDEWPRTDQTHLTEKNVE